MLRKSTWIPALAAVALALASLAPARADEPLKLRISWAVVPGQLTSVLFTNPAILKHYGKSYTVELIHFRGSTPQINGLASGDLEFASLAFSSFGLAIQNAHMDDIRAVADLYQDGIPGYYSSEYMVRADGPKKIEDLKGKILATNAIGGAVDIASKAMLLKHGLKDKTDYQVVEVEFPNMLAALDEKKVDLATVIMPFAIGAHKQQDKYRTLFTVGQAMGPAQTTLLVARAPFIAAHRAALVDFFEDWIRALHWFYDPKNREAAIKIVADFTKKQPGDYADWLFTKKDNYRDVNAKPNLAALQANLKVQKDLGFLNTDIDVKKYADTSLVTEAAKRLK